MVFTLAFTFAACSLADCNPASGALMSNWSSTGTSEDAGAVQIGNFSWLPVFTTTLIAGPRITRQLVLAWVVEAAL